MSRLLPLLLLCALARWAIAATIDAALTSTPPRATERCYAVDLVANAKGILLSGSTQTALAPGRYRLHVPVALAPLGDLRVSEIGVTVAAGGTSRTVKVLHFPLPDAFTDLPLEFTITDRQHTPYTVSWAFLGKLAEKNREKTLKAPDGPDPDENGNLDELVNAPHTAEDGTIAVSELTKIPVHLAALKPWVEALGPLQVGVATDKIVYKPGEKGAGTITVRNLGEIPAQVALQVELRAGVREIRPVATATLDIPAGESRQWTGAFSLDGLYWGAELHATATPVGGPAAEARAIFAVAANMWETAIICGTNMIAFFHGAEKTAKKVTELRAAGYTGFESGFWAPDDYADFTPDTESFYGGHCCYHGYTSTTKDYIDLCHKNGISAAVYSLTTAGSGPNIFEIMRKHPDWIASAEFVSHWLEHWSLMERGITEPTGVWPYAHVAWGKSDSLIRLHAQEFIAAHQQFGWDATRYDVYDDTVPWVINTTRTVRGIVEKAVPAYQWGFNTGVSDKVTPEAYQVMLENGGLLMDEAPRDLAERAGTFSGYLKNALTYRDAIWPYHGHYGICYDPPAGYSGLEPYNPNTLYGNKLDELYLCTLLLAAGAHPFYGHMEHEVGQYPAFALRYADYLWNNNMRPLRNATAIVQFGGTPALLEWGRLARRLDLPNNRHRLVLHLILPPGRDNAHDPTMKTNVPLRDLPLTLTLPEDAKFDGAWILTPIPTPTQSAVPAKQHGHTVTLTVPEVRLWTMVVVEYTGKMGLE